MLFRTTVSFLVIGISALAHSHPSNARRRLAPDVSIVEALQDQLASGINHPRFTLTADYTNGGGGLFTSSKSLEIDVVLTNPSVGIDTSFSVDGGPSTSVVGTSKYLVADKVKASDDDLLSKNFAILTVDEEESSVRGLVQKEGKLFKLEQLQGGKAFVTEVDDFEPPKDWECTAKHEELPEPVVERETRRLKGKDAHHDHDHHHHHHDHSHDHQHHDHHKLSLTADSIFTEISKVNPDILKRRRRVYATDDWPLKWSYQVDLYIEIDQYLVDAHDTDKLNMPKTLEYVNALITAASSVYEQEVDTHLHVMHIAKTSIYDGQTSTSGALTTMINQYASGSWHYTDPVTGQKPDLHHAILWRQIGGGIAYVGAVCNSNYGYGVSAGIQGSLEQIGGEMFWDLVVIMHEIGHNFGSYHSHDDNNGYSPKIDACGDYQCTSLATGSYVGDGEGTIMSYCHLCSGGTGNIGATFGGYWNGNDSRGDINNWMNNEGVVPFSRDPRRVPKVMYEHVSSRGQCVEPYLPVPSQVCATDLDCNDGDECTLDSCDANTGECSNVAIDSCSPPTPNPVTSAPSTNSPTMKPNTSAPTSAAVADYVRVGTGYCYDSSDNWYSAFKSVDLPSSTTDTFCIQWCLQNKRSNLVAVEIYRGDGNMNCYCDFSGGSVPDDISTSDYNPLSQGALTYPGVGPVAKTDFVSSATCYRNNNFMQTPSPTSQSATPNPTRSPSTKSPSTKPTNFPTMKPTSPPTTKPTNSPTNMPTKSPTGKPTAPPTNSPTSKPTAPPTSSPSASSPVSSAPTSTSGGLQDASFDASFGVPRCASVGSACSSGTLLDGRANLGPETNQPNTLGGQCKDGTSGTYHNDESLDKVVVRSGEIDGTGSDVNLVEGGRATITATVFAWGSGASDTADFFYTSDASNPDWQYIGSVTPSTGGEQDLKISYNLPQGTNQAVRVQVRYLGSINECASGSYNDRDDLMFTVDQGASQPTPSPIKTQPPTELVGGGPQQASYDSSLTVPRCVAYGSECDSLALLKGRGTMSNGGTESNAPNTLSDTCFDGNSGSYLNDESIERIVVRSGNIDGLGSGVDMMEGSKATIIATVYPWFSGFYDYADFYYASDSSNPVWQFIATERPAGSGLQELKVDYNLPAGNHQAVRVNFRYRGQQGVNGACSGGSWDDIDDLAFGVKVNPSFTLVPSEMVAEEPKDVTVDAKKRNELRANQSKNRKGSKSSKNSKRKLRD